MAQITAAFDIQLYTGYLATDIPLLERYRDINARPEKGFVVEFTGARTRISTLWDEAKTFHGTVLNLPIPVDFHAETAEWVGVLKSIESAQDQFVVMELGAGYGAWCVGSGVAARLRGLETIRLYAVEGDQDHVKAMHQHFVDNGFDPTDHIIINAAVGTATGKAAWPKANGASSAEWGLRPQDAGKGDYAGRSFDQYSELDVVSLAELLRREVCWDLLHIDIQGHEVEVCRSSIAEMNERVRWVVVGTHSRKLDGDMIELMTGAGWILENEKPTIFNFSQNPTTLEAMTILDGTQAWRNPRLPSALQSVESVPARLHGAEVSGAIRKLNYGCGYDKRADYLNVDMDPNCAPDILIQNMDFSAIPKNYFEEVCALDVLEHIPRSQALSALLDWAEFLQMGGRLVLQTSSVLGISRLFEQSGSFAEHYAYSIFLFGNQAHPGDFHHTGFTEITLKAHLVSAGFAPSEIITRDRWLFHTETQKIFDWTELASRPYLSVQQFIDEAYQTALNREPDDNGRSFLLQMLRSEGWSRRDALRHLFAAPERLFVAAKSIGLA